MNKTHLFIHSPQTAEGYSHASPQIGEPPHLNTTMRLKLYVAAKVLLLRSYTLALLSLAASMLFPAAMPSDTENLLAPTTDANRLRQTYLLAATIFTKIASLNAATDTKLFSRIMASE